MKEAKRLSWALLAFRVWGAALVLAGGGLLLQTAGVVRRVPLEAGWGRAALPVLLDALLIVAGLVLLALLGWARGWVRAVAAHAQGTPDAAGEALGVLSARVQGAAQALQVGAVALPVLLLLAAPKVLLTRYDMWAAGLPLGDRPMLLGVGVSVLAVVLLPLAALAVVTFGQWRGWVEVVHGRLDGARDASVIRATGRLNGPVRAATFVAGAVGVVAAVVWMQTQSLAAQPDPYAAPMEAVRALFPLHEAWVGGLVAGSALGATALLWAARSFAWAVAHRLEPQVSRMGEFLARRPS
ncbi:hypothetical protein [Deinococcus maricopensis]|uniref:Major facilitator superfamily transporter n=1 Tax=Deinococcus maricopensis (strain DSM 21211 / LMG 22137 / NRRL B-23946 / LB-34) TaxID=709986 RepID=E8U4Z2_DEIML|nr:hypothetical protein [Deinococcus maricopensis]ADV66131.1 major facilitator superfamily transporter [Deinococcus maricopensis DSM 21211]